MSIQFGYVSIHSGHSSINLGSLLVPRETLVEKFLSGFLVYYRKIHYLCHRILEYFIMEVMKVLSVRLSESELANIEKVAKNYRYFKRSDVIRAAIQFFERYATSGMKHEILAGYGQNWKGYEFTIEKGDLMHNPKGNQE